jgi:hypothetical protein
MNTTETTLKRVRLASGAAVVLVGWVFILIYNSFHVTPPVVFVCLAFLAVVAAIYNLFRTGAVAAASADGDADLELETLGASGLRLELEREKRTLLKAIKEAEFDHQMGKLSKRDFDEMIQVYRTRAIEVIKLLDGAGGTAREQIQREVRARLEIEGKAKKKAIADAEAKKAKKKKSQKTDEPKAEEEPKAADEPKEATS